jgi:hypothetical protein
MTQNKAKIIKASQDGSKPTLLKDVHIQYPFTLAIDLVLRKVIWFHYHLSTFSSIHFDGNKYLY